MQTNTQNLPSLMHRLALAGMLSLLVALSLAIVIPLLKTAFFGSDFEGSSGYMAAFIFTPAVILVLTPILVMLLRKASPLVCLGLWLLVLLILGFFFLNLFFGYWLGSALWLGGLVVLSWKMVKQWRIQA